MFTIDEIQQATGGNVHGHGGLKVTGVSTDSRTITAGELFIPLRGERFDGHDYLDAAIGRGVTTVLAEESWLATQALPGDITCIAVTDTLRALGDLAAFHRRRFHIPVVGITGSNGKTTTKEMLASILSQGGAGLKTGGNLNNLIGLPLTLLKLTANDRWAVLEMGMSEPGEIDRLAEIAAPDVGIITNAFPAHLLSMGSVDAVARAKGELFLRLGTDCCAVYNADDSRIAALPVPAGVRRLSFGLHGADVSAVQIVGMGRRGQRFTLRLPGRSIGIELQALGQHNVSNALAAAAAATAIGIEPEQVRAGLDAFTPYDKRFRLEEVEGVVLIDDSYNANPASMAAALLTLSSLKGRGRTIAVLGDMLELGRDEEKAHLEVGRLAAACVDKLYLTGDMATIVAAGAADAGLAEENIVVAAGHEGVIAALSRSMRHDDVILVKGSRGMRMEIVAEAIRSGFAADGKGGA
jgi:UDP-N-acetylmuramoyl-tripeptide--D-alanyl-D-alanine ligase